jgi:hypothetical protein
MSIPQKLKIVLPYDLAIPFLGMYPEELKAESIPVLIGTLLRIVKVPTQVSINR